MNKSLNILNDYYMYKRSYYSIRGLTPPHTLQVVFSFYEFLVSSLTHPVYLKYQSVHNFSIQILHILFLFSAHSKINTHTYNISFWHLDTVFNKDTGLSGIWVHNYLLAHGSVYRNVYCVVWYLPWTKFPSSIQYTLLN